MKRILQKLSLALALVLALGLLAGCGGGAGNGAAGESGGGTPPAGDGSDRLVIWSYLNEGEPVAVWQQSVVEAYKAAYPGVEVEIVFCGREILTQFQTKLNDKGSADFPDLVSQMSGTMIPLAMEGQFMPLDDAFATPAFDQDMNWGDTLVENLMQSMVLDGKNYLVPEAVYTHGFFYDQVMFDAYNLEVPTTWAQLLEVCDTLKANGIAPVALDGTLDVYNEWWWIRFATRLVGPEKLDAAARGELSFKAEPGFLQAAEYLQTFVDNGYFQSGYEGSVFPAAQAMFTQGTAGMLFCGAWIPSEMESQTPPEMQMRMFTLPELPNSASAWHEEIWANCFAVPVDAHNKENAIDFLKVYSSMGVQQEKSDIKNPSPLVGGPPVAELANIEQQVNGATTTSTTYAGLALYGDWFKNILGPLATELVCGNIDAAEFIDRLDADTAKFYG